jgi:hypothetical protein
MKDLRKLHTIKLIHSLIWAFMVAVIFYVLYCGVFDNVNLLTWISIGIIIMEGIVLLAFNMYCPLTVWARKYSDSTKDNFDIYLPNWLAKYNKQIFTTIYLLGLITVIYRVI